MTPRRALLAALTFTATLALILMAGAVPASADYSDHGTPDTSLVASTHPGQPVTGGSLPDTGSALADLALWGSVVLIAGLILSAAAQLAAGKRGRVR